ncbi:MAG: hypothetical protein II680_14735 [Clostridia bacterium]|nr:hypothetical protein [Clostridia bacterium]
MRTRRSIRVIPLILLAAVLMLGTLAVTVFADGDGEGGGSFAYATALSLLPPLVAIVLALITKEVYSSLFIGIIAGGLLATNFSFAGTLDTVINDGIIQAVSDNAGVFIFLVILGVLVALLNRTGASAAFGKWAQKNIKTRVGAQLATFFLGVLIFIDDYFNCLTVGSVMQPVTDTHRISRAKLAFLIDATAAPVCMIAPISSWAAAVSSYAEGTGYSGLSLFVRAIPYNFYSLLTLVFIIALALMKFDYGPMALHEKNAIEKGDLFTSGTEHASEDTAPKGTRGRVFDLVIPIVVLILVCVIGLVYVGGFFGTDIWGGTDFGGDFIGAFSNTDATIGLPWGGIITLVAVMIYLVCRRTISFKDAMECFPAGFKAMVPAILILTFAGSLLIAELKGDYEERQKLLGQTEVDLLNAQQQLDIINDSLAMTEERKRHTEKELEEDEERLKEAKARFKNVVEAGLDIEKQVRDRETYLRSLSSMSYWKMQERIPEMIKEDLSRILNKRFPGRVEEFERVERPVREDDKSTLETFIHLKVTRDDEGAPYEMMVREMDASVWSDGRPYRSRDGKVATLPGIIDYFSRELTPEGKEFVESLFKRPAETKVEESDPVIARLEEEIGEMDVVSVTALKTNGKETGKMYHFIARDKKITAVSDYAAKEICYCNGHARKGVFYLEVWRTLSGKPAISVGNRVYSQEYKRKHGQGRGI